jgi:hypothetical protein
LIRGGLPLDELLQKLERQCAGGDRGQMADFVIHNNSAEEQMAAEAKKIYNRLG